MEKIDAPKNIEKELLRHWDILENIVLERTGELKRAEEELRDAYIEIELLLSSIANVLIGVSIKDNITHWNSIAENIFGIPASEVLNKSIIRSKIRWEWDRIYEGIYLCIADDGVVKLNDICYKTAENKDGYIDIAINPMKDKNNALKGFLLAGEDTTKRRMLEAQLIQSQKLESIGQLAAGIAHEINTPAQYITNNICFLKDSFVDFNLLIKRNIELLQSYKSENNYSRIIEEIGNIIQDNDFDYLAEEIPKAIDQSISGLDHIKKIVQSMKQFAHPGTENKTPVNINRAIESTINISRNEWKYIANVITNFDEDMPSVICFPNELNQVLLNMIINAAHAIEEKTPKDVEEKGEISIATKSDGDWAEIRIADNGKGIAEEIRSRIFDPFFTTKEIGKGSGQGLAIAHTVIVQNHGGSITVNSNENKGTTFVIKIPIKGN